MGTATITLTNLLTGNLSLDLKFGEGNQLRKLLATAGTVDLAPYASLDEINSHAQLTAMRVAGSISIAAAAGVDDIPGFTPLGAAAGIKEPCRLASTANRALSGLTAVDSVTPVAGDRILLKDQSAGAENGIYIAASGTWTRAPDANSIGDFTPGFRVGISEGTVNDNTLWALTTNAADLLVLDTDSMAFTQGVNAELTSAAPANVTKAAASAGVGATAARVDHKHDITTAAPSTGIGASNAEGSSTSLARADHDHVLRESGATALTLGAMADLAIVARSATTLVASVPISGVPVGRTTVAADSLLAADVIGATTEAIHTAISLTSEQIATLRRIIKFRARLHVTGANGADTWTFKARLGGLAGVLLLSSGAINITADDIYEFEGTIEIRTLGAPGTFDAVTKFKDYVAAADVDGAVVAGAITTTGAVSLVITGECSSANAGNTVSMRHFSAEILNA